MVAPKKTRAKSAQRARTTTVKKTADTAYTAFERLTSLIFTVLAIVFLLLIISRYAY